MDDLWQQNAQFGRWAGIGWEWASLAFLAGGLWLLYQRVFTWHAPIAMLAALALTAALFYDGGSSRQRRAHLYSTCSVARPCSVHSFIVTDPVSSAVSTRGRLVFGALVGLLVYLIRVRWQLSRCRRFRRVDHEFRGPVYRPLHATTLIRTRGKRREDQ